MARPSTATGSSEQSSLVRGIAILAALVLIPLGLAFACSSGGDDTSDSDSTTTIEDRFPDAGVERDDSRTGRGNEPSNTPGDGSDGDT
jgi:hypothetical protein